MDHPIRQLRERLGLSQESVAEIAKVTHQQISNVECGISSLGPKPALRLWRRYMEAFAALGYGLDDLLDPPGGGKAA